MADARQEPRKNGEGGVGKRRSGVHARKARMSSAGTASSASARKKKKGVGQGDLTQEKPRRRQAPVGGRQWTNQATGEGKRRGSHQSRQRGTVEK